MRESARARAGPIPGRSVNFHGSERCTLAPVDLRVPLIVLNAALALASRAQTAWIACPRTSALPTQREIGSPVGRARLAPERDLRKGSPVASGLRDSPELVKTCRILTVGGEDRGV